ncbi:ATP-binding protein [Octadecabacter sp. 1_MG-2023]|uniref:ATP-binding protein n=1 Tax=unclassified Octadecabacter TaxID=196158 RepID=UPI001C090489|nr:MULTISPECIES: ATP-binding protein [unclassified Octadecabacter]MBU2993569.1 HAMP domain-containing protein [Octadecabacter sp. B2R22]MDO6735587.1 ATP-binding protein [Octadecabacter sp. 1_MG-2023]
MSFKWLKRYLPRSLYGRAALILILPVITLQLGISVGFIQRHFERVTTQMTESIVLDLRYLLETVNAAETLDAAQTAGESIADPLELMMVLPASDLPTEGMRVWYDLTGRVVERTLKDNLDGLGPVVLPNSGSVQLWLYTSHGAMMVEFDRVRVSATNPHQLLVWMVALGAFMTLISFIYLRNQLRPITRLAAAATDYGRGRIVPYHPSGANEVRAAGHAFLDMRNRIERQTQTRTMMLSGVSHDLRTPLTRLRLGLGLLDGDEVEPLVRDVDDMEHLLNGFLDFARGDAEDGTEPTDPIALAELILADAKRMGQAVHAGEMSGEGHVDVRPMALRRAVENLIGNALRYGAEARLSVSLTPRALVICVEDDGPGIPPEQREDAVRPFTRLDPARNQDRGSGVGLGLAIVEDIARAHGGALRLGESEDLGGLKAEIVLAR